MEHEYFVYMVASRSRTLYVRVTRNLAARVGRHKNRIADGFTADYQCTRLGWYERYQYVRHAILREKQIKRWRREKKVWLIERDNATWEDLAADWWAAPAAPVVRYESRSRSLHSAPLRSG